MYILCLCLLGVLIVSEASQIYRSDTETEIGENKGKVVPTARFARQLKEENANAGNAEKTNEPEREGQTEKTAYLTFDDGPSENTKKILATLKEKNAVATFFLVGNEITPEREAIVKETAAQGNAIGVHTYCHQKNKIYCDAACFFTDYQATSECIEKVTGTVPKLHRFPWGSNNRYVSSYVDELHGKLQEMGVRSYDWNVSGEDSVGGVVAQETIFQNIKKDLCKFDKPIILLHDSATMKNTAAVLGRIIDYIRSEGYGFDTLENREEYMFPASWR